MKAVDHGLPTPELAPKPQRTRKVGGDTVAAAVASEKAGRTGPVRRLTPPPNSGVPVVTKVLIGAVVALALVYGLSQLRKAGNISDAPAPTSTSEEPEQAADDLSSVSPAQPGQGAPEAMGASGEEEESGIPAHELNTAVPSGEPALPAPRPAASAAPSPVSAPVPVSALPTTLVPAPVAPPPDVSAPSSPPAARAPEGRAPEVTAPVNPAPRAPPEAE